MLTVLNLSSLLKVIKMLESVSEKTEKEATNYG